jgi:hypothetical protein
MEVSSVALLLREGLREVDVAMTVVILGFENNSKEVVVVVAVGGDVVLVLGEDVDVDVDADDNPSKPRRRAAGDS